MSKAGMIFGVVASGCLVVSLIVWVAHVPASSPTATVVPAPVPVAGTPTDAVAESGAMEIYAVHLNAKNPAELGRYEYWVSDASTQGWRFLTNKEYSIGDKLSITASPY